MRKTLGRVAILATCVLVAGAALAGSITGRGAAQPTLQSIFRIDTPAPGATVFGIVEVSGFVLDARGVARVTLLVDGAAVHDADINQPRDDVQARYARFFGGDFPYDPGFSTSFLASNYSAGAHTLGIQVTYSNSDVAVLGTRTVTVDATINQAPIGALDNPGDPAVYGTQSYVSGVFPVVGWALDANGIRQRVSPAGCTGAPSPTCQVLADIEVMVDGAVVGQTNYPLPRPDVANAHPDVAGAFQSGFQMNLDTSTFTNGAHTISVRVWDTQGLSTVLGSRDVVFSNGYATLAPFGQINWPMPDATLLLDRLLQRPPAVRHHLQPRRSPGLGLGLGDRSERPGELQGHHVRAALVQRGDSSATRRSIRPTATRWSPPTPQAVPRACTATSASTAPTSSSSTPSSRWTRRTPAFLFAVNTRYYLETGQLHLGLNIIEIWASRKDPIRPFVLVEQIPVIVDCSPVGINPSYGELEHPLAMEAMQGTELVSGWLIDFPQSLRQLNFYVDGVLDGSLVVTAGATNILMQRPDIVKKYPWLPYPNSLYSGFQYSLDTTKYVDGVHQLVIQSVDYSGSTNYWVQRPLVFDNLNRP